VLLGGAVRCIAVQCSARWCNVMLLFATCGRVLQGVAVWCSVVQCACSVLAVCLQCGAVFCSVLGVAV